MNVSTTSQCSISTLCFRFLIKNFRGKGAFRSAGQATVPAGGCRCSESSHLSSRNRQLVSSPRMRCSSVKQPKRSSWTMRPFSRGPSCATPSSGVARSQAKVISPTRRRRKVKPNRERKSATCLKGLRKGSSISSAGTWHYHVTTLRHGTTYYTIIESHFTG